LILKGISTKRHLTQFGFNITSFASRDDTNTLDIVNNALEGLKTIQNRIVSVKPKTFQEKYIEVVDKSLNRNGEDSLGLLTCFNRLNQLTLGYTAPDYIIIAAGPGEGKSTFALNQAVSIASRGQGVLYFSMEMSEEQLIWKMLSAELNKTVSEIRLGKFEAKDAIMSQIANSNIMIYDKGGLTIEDFCGIVKMEKKSKDIKIVFIDYVQLMRVGKYSRKVGTKNDELTIISNQIKQLSMELQIPIVVLSQLNRDKNRKEYNIHDLRDSASLGQDADSVIFIFRPEIHGMNKYEIGNKEIFVNENTAIISIEKQRLGVTGQFEMVFNGMYSRFEDTEEFKIKYETSVKPNKGDIPF
jgi:replicative DNA helicase